LNTAENISTDEAFDVETEATTELFTVTLIAEEVLILPAPSATTATKVWAPSATDVEFQVIEYGDVAPEAPILTLSNLN
jgi:hypothetical protein